ncbi:MAG: hypothetical protein LQ337_005519 [Flavoplaca oasis]|nr:MAG: hypothetical protein LQ337_005519 [Flavoplaca oasis]
MPESNLSFLHFPYELREQIYQLVISNHQSISLKWSSTPRSHRKQTQELPVRYNEMISLRNACRVLRTDTAPIFFTKMLFLLDLDMPRPIDGIYAFIHTFGIDDTNTITRLGFHWRGQNPQYSTLQNESGVHFNMRQISYWASKFSALKEVRLVYPKLSCPRYYSNRILYTRAESTVTKQLLRKVKLFIETQHTMGPTTPLDFHVSHWRDLGHSVHEVGVFKWDFIPDFDWDPNCLTLVPFDENALRIWDSLDSYL